LKTGRVTLLQLHNSITRSRHDQPTSITVDDVLGPKGILEGMKEVHDQGLVDHFGLTGIGDADALRTVMQSKQFATIQAPFHLLNPSTLRATPSALCDPDYGGFLRTAGELNMGIFAIRAFAAGALLDAEPSAHTLKTPFFPLDLYQRDRERARRLSEKLQPGLKLGELALRYCLSQPEITSTIIGFGAPEHVVEADRITGLDLMSADDVANWESLRNQTLER
jgi:aryl-alcohol dehydrogenase-like predicted oxidoreductase